MNALMRELIGEAKIHANNVADSDSKFLKVYTKELTESIVKECCEFVRHYNYACIEEEMPYGITSEIIANYFGVKL